MSDDPRWPPPPEGWALTDKFLRDLYRDERGVVRCDPAVVRCVPVPDADDIPSVQAAAMRAACQRNAEMIQRIDEQILEIRELTRQLCVERESNGYMRSQLNVLTSELQIANAAQEENEELHRLNAELRRQLLKGDTNELDVLRKKVRSLEDENENLREKVSIFEYRRLKVPIEPEPVGGMEVEPPVLDSATIPVVDWAEMAGRFKAENERLRIQNMDLRRQLQDDNALYAANEKLREENAVLRLTSSCNASELWCEELNDLREENRKLRAKVIELYKNLRDAAFPDEPVGGMEVEPPAPPRKGEFVTCTNGHLVCEVVADKIPADGADGWWDWSGWLGAWRLERPPGSDNRPQCPCGADFGHCQTDPPRMLLHIKGRGWA